jgi:two-component system, OmpR family, sensor histidine kinase QseC
MRPSIRTFLLINLLLSVTLITSLAIIGNLFLAHKDIQSQLDSQLIQTAFRIEAFFSDNNNPKNLSIIQKNLQNNLNHVIEEHKKINNTSIMKLRSSTVFQIWNNDGKLILHSALAPKIPFSNGQPGLSTLWLNGKDWHVYTLYNPNMQLTVMVAERSNYRQHLENQLTQDSIIIMLITYPFLGLLIWMIVGRGLGTLKKVAEEVKHRKSTNLSEVNIEAVPTEIEPLVSELNNLFTRLSEAFERNKRFTADAAHELKTPLAALSAQTQVALRADTTEARKQALLKVLSGVNRSAHVVQQLLTLSRMGHDNNVDHDMAPIKLARQASEMAALLAPEAITKNIELELLQPDSKAKIHGNATSINILLRNLIDNAIRYSHENGFVKIDIEENQDKVILSVIDNGPGIPESLRKRVFERFFRMMGNKTTGSGLGLGIVQQIAKLHQAEVRLLTPGSGKGLEVQIIFESI